MSTTPSHQPSGEPQGAHGARLTLIQNAPSLTFRHQASLPKLPIPPLKDTLDRYLEYIHALQTPEELEVSKQRVAEFLEKEGPELQEKLIEYDKDKNSFIEDFWYEAYLNHRSSVVLNVNPFFVLEDDPTPSRNNQITRAASLVLGSLKFINALRKGTLEPDMWRDNQALCMHQYRSLFGCARVPTASKDEALVDNKSKHIVVMCRNQFYWFDVVWEDGVTAITERELIANLKAIRENALKASDVEAASQAVGVLTTEHRATWAKWRSKMLAKNADSLAVLDRALFFVCLDNTTPPDAAAFAATALHGTYSIVNGVQVGTCMNRWYDKLQIIVCENGVAGVNFEHSFVDGHTVLRFVSDVYTDTIIRFAQTIRGGTYSFLEATYRAPQTSQDKDKPRVMPRKLEWTIEPELEEGIKFAEAKLSDLILQNEVDVLEFTSYGKLFITQHNMSPDAFVQMAFVAAYYFQYGSAPNVYEPVLTKRYRHGRTEAARSMTKEALEFVEVFFTEKSPIEKIEALRRAIESQVKVVRNCASGKGVERHLYALESIWAMEQTEKGKTPREMAASKPGIFADAGWQKLNHTILSTSNCGNPSLRLFGFGPVVPDGFGIGYIIKNEGIQVCASSKHRQTSRYLKNLEAYLLRVQDLLLQEEEIRFPHTTTEKKKRFSFKGYGFFDTESSSPETTSHLKPITGVGRALD